MSAEPLLPPRLTLMGRALQPLLSKVREKGSGRPLGAPEPATQALLSRSLHELERAIERLERAVRELGTEAAGNEDAGDAEVYRAVARLESRIDDLLDDHAGLRGVQEGELVEGASLLAEVHRGFLDGVETWLEDMVESIADPAAAVKRQGLPTSGYVELRLVLTLDAPRQLAEFRRWLDLELRRREQADDCRIAVHLAQAGSKQMLRLKRAGEAMGQPLATVTEGLRGPVRSGLLSPSATGEFISKHLERLARVSTRLDRLAARWSSAVGAAEVDEREAAEVIARIGSCIDDLLTGYTDVRRSSAAGAFVRGRALLAENYRHTLGQMRDWLSTTVDALVEPLATCETRGLPTTDWVALLPDLRLDVPPAVDGLRDWADDLSLRREADTEFLGTALAVGLGAWIGCGLFGD